jgi:antitoxin FitA
MAQLTVRKVPDDIVRALRMRAARHGRSAEAELRLILAQSLGGGANDFWSRADALRKAAGRQRSDSAALLREMRDAR